MQQSSSSSSLVEAGDTVVPTKNGLLESEEALSRLQKKLSLWFAAYVIAHKEFPAVLPPISKTPFETLGHQVLVDYDLVTRVVWGVVEKIRDVQDRFRHRRRLHLILVALAGIGIGLVGMVASDEDKVFIGLIAGIGSWIFIAAIYTFATASHFSIEILKIRSEAIASLIAGVVPASLPIPSSLQDPQTQHLLARWDDGSLDRETSLVVLSGNSDRFPGLGTEQFHHTFLFPPLENAEPLSDSFLSSLEDVLLKLCHRTGAIVEHGYVLGANKDTVRWASGLLNSDSAPYLRVPLFDAQQVCNLNSHESCRLYSCYRLTFSDLHTSITFLVRSFHAAGSAACELALLTLGPPSQSRAWIEQRGNDLRRASDKGVRGVQVISHQKRIVWADVIRNGSDTLKPAVERASVNFDWRDLKPMEEDAYEDLEAAVKERKQRTAFWSKVFDDQPHPWRMEHSRTFSSDPFVSQELVVMMKSIYDQAMRAMLDQVDGAGYDVSAYRDSSGRLNISADKIDSIVVGDSVSIGRSKDDQDDNDEKKTSGSNTDKA